MVENIKKTKGFIETPEVISKIMHFYLNLNKNDKLLDLTAGRGNLFLDHPTKNCYGCEIDLGNYAVLQEKGYSNIIKGDVFEKESLIEDESMDALILNPPYGNLENKKSSVDIMNISLRKIKCGGKFAIINQSNYPDRFKNKMEYIKENTEVEFASIFNNELFKPFANVKTLLILGVKGKLETKDCEVWIFDNEKIKVNKRSKFVDIKLLKPEEKKIKVKDFWDRIGNIEFEYVGPPTIEDFNKTIIDFMAWESGLPRELIENPSKLGKALSYFSEKLKDLQKD